MKTKFASIILLCGLGISSCSPGFATITTDGGQEGWMVKEQDGVYLLEPIQ